MSPAPIVPAFLLGAAAPSADILGAAAAAPLDAPTPCDGWDLRALVNHLLYWAPVLAAAGRREPASPAAASEDDADLVIGDWPAVLAAAQKDLVAVWGDPAAWEGTASMGGAPELPAPMVGAMVLGELVVHGWDLARTAGRHPTWPDEVVAATYREMAAMADQGRAMGVFGPAVAVPADAPPLQRLLGLAGRSPGWRP